MPANRKDLNTALKGVELQHRHFAFIAHVIAQMPSHAPSLRAQKDSIARSFADACTRSNAHFDRDRFMAACGIAC
jgi:hypothetical protein